MRLGRKKDKDDKDKDKDKKDKKDKKEKKEKRLSLRTGSLPKKRTIKAKFEIWPQSVSNSRCVWGEDQPAIPIHATIVQNKGKFSDKKLQLTLHCQMDKKAGHKVGEWELQLADYAPDGTDKNINLPVSGKSSNPSILTARVRTTWLKIDSKAILSRTGDGDYDLASESEISDAEGDTSIESDMESDATDLSDDEDDDFEMDDDGKISFSEQKGSKIEKRGSRIFGRSDKKEEHQEKKPKQDKEKKEKETEEKEKERKEKENKEKEDQEKREKEKAEKEEKERKEKEQKEKNVQTQPPPIDDKDSRNMSAVGETFGLCRALYAWKGDKEGDLSFEAGDIIQITRKNERWWEGTLKTGQKGVFPKNYVAEISEREEASVSASATAVPTRPASTGIGGLPPPPTFARPGFPPRTPPQAPTPTTSAQVPTPAPTPTPGPDQSSTPTPTPTPAPATPSVPAATASPALRPPPTLVTPPAISSFKQPQTPPPVTPPTASPMQQATPSPPITPTGVVSPPYSPPARRPPVPVADKAEQEQKEKEERERKEKEEREKKEKEQREEKERKEKAEREKKEKEERERKEKEEREKKEKEQKEKAERERQEKERKEKEAELLRKKQEDERVKREQAEKEKKEREEKERKDKEEQEKKEQHETRKSRLENARALFERGSNITPPPAADHKAEDKKAKIFQSGSLGARIEGLASKKSDTHPPTQASQATTSSLSSRPSGTEEPKSGTAASGVDHTAAAEQNAKLQELQRKLDEALDANQKLQHKGEARAKELQAKLSDLERTVSTKDQEIRSLREGAARGSDAGKRQGEFDGERRQLQKKIEEKEQEIAQLKEENNKTLSRLREEKEKEMARLREDNAKELSKLKDEKREADKKLSAEGDAGAKVAELQRMLSDKNQEIWDLREALAEKDKEIAQAVSRGARETEAVSRRVQELDKQVAEKSEELDKLRTLVENKDREVGELKEKQSRVPSPSASPRSPALNAAEFELQRKQLEALRQQVAKAREDNNSLSQKLTDKEREIRDEKKISDGLRDDLKRAEREKEDVKVALDRERGERERRERDLRSKKDSEGDEMAGLRSEINRLLEDKRSLSISVDTLRSQISKLQDDIKGKQSKIDALEEEVKDLKEELQDKDEELDKMKMELDERTQEAERLKNHVEEHSDKVEKLKVELNVKTEELMERERAEKTEVGKESLLQQKTTKLEKMVRDMHVELNVKKQSLKKAIKQSEQKELEIRRLKDKVEHLKQQLEEAESGKKESESDSEDEDEDEEDKKSKKKKKSKNDDDDDDDEDEDDGKDLKKALKKAEIKKDVLKQRLEKLDMVEKTVLAVEVHRKNESENGREDKDSDDEREPGDGGDAIEVAQDLFWFLEKNGLFDRDHTDQHLLNHVVNALEATLERCASNTEYQSYYLSLVSTLIQNILSDKEKIEPFHIDEDLIDACLAMREEGITVIEARRARQEEEKQNRMRAAMNFAASSSSHELDTRGSRSSQPSERGRGSPYSQSPSRGGRGGTDMPPGRGRGGPGPMDGNGRGGRGGGERGRGGAPPPGRGRGEFGGPPGRGGGGPPSWPNSPGGRDAPEDWGGPPQYASGSGSVDTRGGRGGGPPPTDFDEHPRRPSSGGGWREEDHAEPKNDAEGSRKKRPELRRTATGESLLSSFLRRLYFVAEGIFLDMHTTVVDTVSALLIPAILSHPNPGNSMAPPKAGGARVQNLPSPAAMSGAGADRMPPTEEDITHRLDTVFVQLSAHSVFPVIIQQFAETVFCSINVVLLNMVLKRPELCTCSNGFKMKWSLARLTSWLYKGHNEPYSFAQPEVIENQLKPIMEAATLLVMDKAGFAKPQSVRQQFVELSGPQLRALLFNFRPDAMAPDKVAEEWKNTTKAMASREGGPLFLTDPLLGQV